MATDKFLLQKVNYIHENPVRKGFVKVPEHWRYSLAGHWIDGEIGDIPIADFGEG